MDLTLKFPSSATRRRKAAAKAAFLCSVIAFPTLSSLMLAAPAARAAQAASPSADASGGAIVTSPTYKIVPEDVLLIAVIDHPDIDRTLPVMTDGTIDYPYVGQINVAGMTVSELKQRLTKDLTKQFVHPQVMVTVSQRKVRTFTTAGSVLKSAGDHPLKENERLLEALADAGGLPTDRPEFFSAKVLRRGQEIPVDLKRLYNNDPEANIQLQPGDVIYVQEREPSDTTIQVVGEVAKPGPVLYPRDGSLVTVLQAAGGPTPQRALLSKVAIDRGGKTIIVDMRDYLKTGFEPAEKLQPGDRVTVPENRMEYYVVGPITGAGARVYPDDKQITVFSAIATSGVTEGLELKKTKLVHPKPDGTTETRLVNVEKMMKTGDLSGDLPVAPGDSVVIPPSAGRHGVDINTLATGLGLTTSILAILAYTRR